MVLKMDPLKNSSSNLTSDLGNIKLGHPADKYELIEISEDEVDNQEIIEINSDDETADYEVVEIDLESRTLHHHKIVEIDSEDEADDLKIIDSSLNNKSEDVVGVHARNGSKRKIVEILLEERDHLEDKIDYLKTVEIPVGNKSDDHAVSIKCDEKMVETSKDEESILPQPSSPYGFFDNQNLTDDEKLMNHQKILTPLRDCSVILHNSVDQSEISRCDKCIKSEPPIGKTETERLQCRLCHNFYSTKLYLKYHACAADNSEVKDFNHSYSFLKKYKLKKQLKHNQGNPVNFKPEDRGGEENVKQEQQHVSTNKMLRICNNCGKGFRKKKSLKRHILTHNNENSNKRGEFFNLEANLAQHQKVCHNSEEVFKPDVNLIPTNERPHVCEECGKGYSKYQYLSNHHNRIHIKKATYDCKICGKKFKVKWNLKMHLRTHSNEKPFVCETCGKGFKQNINLIYHRRIHTDERPYDCYICGRTRV